MQHNTSSDFRDSVLRLRAYVHPIFIRIHQCKKGDTVRILSMLTQSTLGGTMVV